MKKKNIVYKIAAGILCLLLFALIVMSCNDFEKVPLTSTEGQSYEKAVVTKIIKDNLQEDGNRYGNQEVQLKIKSGALKGETVNATSPNGTLFGAACTEGMDVIAIVSISGGEHVVTVYSQDRTVPIYVFLAVFVLTVCLIGGARGVKAILSLIFTGICILYVMFPLIYQGKSPIPVTIVVCVIATLFTMIMIGGFTKKTFSAVLGTTCGVTAAGIFAFLFGKYAGISGYNVSNIETLSFVAQYVPVRIGDLLFSGIILSALGAVMDVGMSISSTLQEIYEKNPATSQKQLFLSGIHVGRDMMGTMVNTLILAFVGGSMTTLFIDYAYNLSYHQLFHSYNIGIEIMQGLAGSMGVVLTVPFTAAVASAAITRRGARGEQKEDSQEKSW